MVALRFRAGILSPMAEFVGPHPISTSPTAPATHVVCPYLLVPDGRWRSASPARAHRCTAVVPAAPLAAEKQRRLCLVGDHLGCATFLVATGAVEGDDGAARSRASLAAGRALTRTAPLILDHGRLPVSVNVLARDRGVGQGALLLLMAVAFAAIFIARLSSGGGGSADAGGVLAGVGTPGPSPEHAAVPTVSPSIAASVPPTLVPTAVQPIPVQGPSPTAVPEAGADASGGPTTYKVRRGDTLSGIASEFGTTVKILSALNEIDDPSRLRVGQVLQLP